VSNLVELNICISILLLSNLLFSLFKECSKFALTCRFCPFLCSVCPKDVQNLHLPLYVVLSCVQFVQRMFRICTYVSMLSILVFTLSKECSKSALTSRCCPFLCSVCPKNVQNLHLLLDVVHSFVYLVQRICNTQQL
jgi:hypothetical protein